MRSQSEIVKDWLDAYRNEEKQIDEQLEKIRELRARTMSVGAQELSAMPRAPLKIKDGLAEYMIRLEELESRLSYRMKNHERDRAAILDLIDKLEKQDERQIIKRRYLFGCEWLQIMVDVYGKSNGFDEHKEAFRRRMYRAHDSALTNMGRLWGNKKVRH